MLFGSGNNTPHLLESIFADDAPGVFKQQMAGRFNARNACHEGTGGILIGIKAMTAVQGFFIGRGNRIRLGLPEQPIVEFKTFHNTRQNENALCFFPYYMEKGHGIGSITHELFLVYVQPDSDNARLQMLPANRIFNQHAPYLFIPPVNVVRPFDRKPVRVVFQRFFCRQRGNLRYNELPVGKQEIRKYLNTEQKVPAAFSFPFVVSLTAPCRLVVNADQRHIFGRKWFIPFEEIIRGVCRLQLNPFKPRRVV